MALTGTHWQPFARASSRESLLITGLCRISKGAGTLSPTGAQASVPGQVFRVRVSRLIEVWPGNKVFRSRERTPFARRTTAPTTPWRQRGILADERDSSCFSGSRERTGLNKNRAVPFEGAEDGRLGARAIFDTFVQPSGQRTWESREESGFGESIECSEGSGHRSDAGACHEPSCRRSSVQERPVTWMVKFD